MTADYLRTLVDYHYWARDRVLDAVVGLSADDYARDLGSSFPSVRATLQHTFGAEVVWLRRWQGVSPTTFPGAMPADLSGLRALWLEHEQQLRAFIDSLDDQSVHEVVYYRLFSGAEGESSIWQMVAHVVNHATYHRGQVTTMLRQLGAEPAKRMDMIAYFRERRA
ncbi:MAG: DinB family protein [Gemmatimonadaceae bacterium]|nr:DinB family protein [Gemmatimonadaceae bacterium]